MTMKIQDHKQRSEGLKKKYTILVSTWSSQCGYCGQDVLPSDKTHHTVSGYGPQTEVCGIEFKYMCGLYTFNVDPEFSITKHMDREDLIPISIDQLNEEEN